MWTARMAVPLLAATLAMLPLALHQRPSPGGEWPAYGGDAEGSRFSSLTQVHRGNVAALRVAWTFHTGEARRGGTLHHAAFETTPLVVDGTMYVSTPGGLVIALVPETGRVRWRFDARVDSTSHFARSSCGWSGSTGPAPSGIASASLLAPRPSACEERSPRCWRDSIRQCSSASAGAT
jgi:glucose dehydrogenase